MKRFPIVLVVVALGAAGFAAASIASGGHLLQVLAGTTVTMPTVTTTPTTTTTPQGGRRVTICHHTGSKKHPFHTITVDQHAVKAHLHHGDTLGACPTVMPAPVTAATSHGKSNGKGKSHGGTTTAPVAPTTTTTTTTSSDDQGHGNSGDHGKGHGKP